MKPFRPCEKLFHAIGSRMLFQLFLAVRRLHCFGFHGTSRKLAKSSRLLCIHASKFSDLSDYGVNTSMIHSCCSSNSYVYRLLASTRARAITDLRPPPVAGWWSYIGDLSIPPSAAAAKTHFIIGLSTPIILPSTNLPLPPDSAAEFNGLVIRQTVTGSISAEGYTCALRNMLASFKWWIGEASDVSWITPQFLLMIEQLDEKKSYLPYLSLKCLSLAPNKRGKCPWRFPIGANSKAQLHQRRLT
jgi:hypothetical protein